MRWLKGFLIAYKLILFAVFVVSYVLCSLLARLSSNSLTIRRRWYVRIVSVHCKMALWLMRFKVRAINNPPKEQHYLQVGNHLGMLDILITSSLRPTLFVTSQEMRATPFLGFLTELGGCLYVERRDRTNIQNEMLEIRKALQDGFNVVLYPEGTSGNGERVLPFKKTLLTAAAGTGVPVLPMIVNFRKVNGEPISLKWRDYVCWYGDMTFFPSLIKIFSVYSVEVDFEFAEPMMIHSEEERSHFAVDVQKVVESKFDPIS